MKNIQAIIKIVESYYNERADYYIQNVTGVNINPNQIKKFYKDRLEHCLRMLTVMENIMFTYPNYYSYEKYQAILAAIILHDIEKCPKQFITGEDRHDEDGATKAGIILENMFDDNIIEEICSTIKNHSDKHLSKDDVEKCNMRYILVCLDVADKVGPNTIYLNVAKNPLITYDDLFTNMKDLYMRVNSIVNESIGMEHNPIRAAIVQLLKTRNSQLLDALTAFQLAVKTY